MSAIGDYIHYYGSNYAKHGINDSKSGASYVPFNFQMQENEIMSRVAANGATAQIPDNLALEMSKVLSNNISSNSNEDKIQQAVLKKMEEEFGLRLGKINWDTLTVDVSNMAHFEDDALKALRKQKQSFNNINRRIQELQQWITSVEAEISTNQDLRPTNLEAIKTQLKNVIKEFGSICKIANQDLENTGWNFDLASVMDGRNPMFLFDEKNKDSALDNVINQINQIIEVLQSPAQSFPQSLENGTLLEYVAGACSEVAEELAEETVDDLVETITKTYTGDQRFQRQINTANFVREIKQVEKTRNLTSIDIKDPETGNCMQLLVPATKQGKASNLKVQEKVDLIITAGEGNKAALISAKNYNKKSSSSVHLLSSSPMTYLIQDENNNNFINHYLNLTAAHPGEWKGEMEGQLQAARQAMKMTLTWKALSGDTFKDRTAKEGTEKNANVFLFHDESKTGAASIKICTMEQLMNKLLTETNQLQAIVITANDTPLDKVRWTNAYDEKGSASTRIAKMLTNIYDTKISVALKPSVFT